MRLCVYTIFNSAGKPLTTAVGYSSTFKLFKLWAPNTGICVYDIWQSQLAIIDLMRKVVALGGEIVINDYKSHLSAFDGLLDLWLPNISEIILPSIQYDAEKIEEISRLVIKKMELVDVKPWQKIFAMASPVYQSLENRGVLVGSLPHFPKWSQMTYTGRSKTLGFNIQGSTDQDEITNPCGPQSDVLLHFDWRAADIRIASKLSGDIKLDVMSRSGDPYQLMADEIGEVSRENCKTALLSAINAMDISNPLLNMFPDLRSWIERCNTDLSRGNGVLTILDRLFKPRVDKPRAPFNATMQGSIAHAMHITIRRLWDEFPQNLLAEVHDSIVLTCNKDQRIINDMIIKVVDIMRSPFINLLNYELVLPVKVSIGTKWRKWKQYKVFC